MVPKVECMVLFKAPNILRSLARSVILMMINHALLMPEDTLQLSESASLFPIITGLHNMLLDDELYINLLDTSLLLLLSTLWVYIVCLFVMPCVTPNLHQWHIKHSCFELYKRLLFISLKIEHIVKASWTQESKYIGENYFFIIYLLSYWYKYHP